MDSNPDEAWGMLSDLAAARDEVFNSRFEFADTREIIPVANYIRMITFSDTILVFTLGDSLTELRITLIALAELFGKVIFKRVPIRAGISYGKFFFNPPRSMYAGPALIEAYRVGEASQWLGIVLSDSVKDKAISLGQLVGDQPLIIEWDTPQKNLTKKCGVVNWPAGMAHHLTVSPPISIRQFYEAFQSAFGDFDDLPSDVQQKYYNTVDFMNAQLMGH